MPDATSSPVHTTSAPETRWSRVNYAEAIQGVQTPLGWTLWEHVFNRSALQAFVALGVLRSPERDTSGERHVFAECFFGRPTANVGTFHRIGELMPGTDGDALIAQIFGEPDGLAAESRLPIVGRRRRYATVAAKFLPTAIRFERMVVPMREDYRRWWKAAVIDQPPASLADATALLADAGERFTHAGTVHVLVSFLGQALNDQVEELAKKAWGTTEGAADLTTGVGGLEEAGMMIDIWSVAADRLTFGEFIGRHGYHGPDEGAIDSVVWRENPAPAQRLVDRYRDSAVAHPSAREATQAARRGHAEQRLAAGLGPLSRVRARLTLRLTRRVVPKREVGKAAYLHAIDAARCAARVIGRELAAQRLIDDPEDVFFLTYDELCRGIDSPVQELVVQRQAHHVQFEALAVPIAWTGDPQPEGPAVEGAQLEVVETLQGIGVVGDAITGRARVIFDPDDADLEPGDVLVCRTTDPSWTPLFLLADALVIDTGGIMSHGAIVARELGVTCVINTKTGTRDIPDGAIISVDGQTGAVHVLDASTTAATPDGSH